MVWDTASSTVHANAARYLQDNQVWAESFQKQQPIESQNLNLRRVAGQRPHTRSLLGIFYIESLTVPRRPKMGPSPPLRRLSTRSPSSKGPPAWAAATQLRACTGGSSNAGATDSSSTVGIGRDGCGGIMSCSVRMAVSGATTDVVCQHRRSYSHNPALLEGYTISQQSEYYWQFSV